jgi:hypothetical protein
MEPKKSIRFTPNELSISSRNLALKIRTVFTLFFIITVALGCGPKNGIPGREILGAPDKVEAFRVDPDPAEASDGKAVRGYPITATGKEQTADFTGRLGKVLSGSGVTQNQKKCGLSPGVAYRITKGKRIMEVLICFNVMWLENRSILRILIVNF